MAPASSKPAAGARWVLKSVTQTSQHVTAGRANTHCDYTYLLFGVVETNGDRPKLPQTYRHIKRIIFFKVTSKERSQLLPLSVDKDCLFVVVVVVAASRYEVGRTSFTTSEPKKNVSPTETWWRRCFWDVWNNCYKWQMYQLWYDNRAWLERHRHLIRAVIWLILWPFPRPFHKHMMKEYVRSRFYRDRQH